MQDPVPQFWRIRTAKVESVSEHLGLVLATRVVEIQTVSLQLLQVNNRPIPVRQPHDLSPSDILFPMSDFLRSIILLVAGWVNRQQQAQIEYLLEKNRVLREHIPARRIRFTDDQRRRLAVKARALGRGALKQIAGIVTPETLLRKYSVNPI